MADVPADSAPMFLPRSALNDLVALLRGRGYLVIGPKLTGSSIMLGPIESADELAGALRDEQSGGSYRLARGDADLKFEYVVGPNSPRVFCLPTSQRLYQFHMEGGHFVLDAGPPQVPRIAFLGIRPCDAAAMRVQDRAFGVFGDATPRCESETYYIEARRQSMSIVVNCTRPGGNCFCASMGTGPAVKEGFDLALTELRAGFVVTAGSQTGREILKELPVRQPSSTELELAEMKMHIAGEHMGKKLDTTGLKKLLDTSIEQSSWDDVAKRCLSCGNCTMVCPTCFCSTVQDGTTAGDNRISRNRQWESCFTHQFTYTTAGPLRNTIRGRYRHWMRHKLCTWFDQFGCSGCVGCGRCITWCPVGIDITAEAARIRQSQETMQGAKPQEVRP
jgi:sulfhydrogenase subunit beta (sulfur reductase)